MALIAHYPFTQADINDRSPQGNDLEYLNDSGALSSDGGGKLGNCHQRSVYNTTDFLQAKEKINLTGDFTLMCWAKVTQCSSSANGLVTNHSHSDNSGPGITVKYISSTDYRISCNTGNGSSRTYHTYYGTTNIKGEYHHLVMRYKDGQITLWVNGNIETTVSYSMYCIDDYLEIFNWSTTQSHDQWYRPICKLNDVRVYNHACSESEIKEIAKGKFLHRTYNQDIADNLIGSSGYDTERERIGSGSTYPYASSDITDAVMKRWSPTNNKFCMQFEGKRDVGDRYPRMYIYFTDWSWSTIVQTTEYGYTLASKSNITMPDPTGKAIVFGMYNYPNSGSGVSYSKNHMINWGEDRAPFIKGDFDNAVYDCSGCDHHGTMTDYPTISRSSGLGTGTMRFYSDTTNAVSGLIPIYATQLTINTWVYLNDHPSEQAPLMEGDAYQVIRYGKLSSYWFAANPAGYHSSNASIPLNEWTMVTSVWSGTQLKLYINGVLDRTISTTVTQGNRTLNARTGYVNANRYMDGEVADNRMYATALSDDDVRLLYQSKANVDNSGVFRVHELVADKATANNRTDQTLVKVAGSGLNSPNATDGGFWLDGVYTGYRDRGMNVYVLDHNLEPWAAGSFDLYTNGDYVLQHYTDKHASWTISGTDVAIPKLIELIENIPDGYLCAFYTYDAAYTNASLNTVMKKYFNSTEIVKLTSVRDHFTLLGHKNGELYYDDHKSNSTSVLVSSYTKGFYPGQSITADSIGQFNDVSEVGITEGIQGYWKFDGIVDDYSLNGWDMNDSSTSQTGLQGTITTTGMMDGRLAGDMTLVCYVTVHTTPSGSSRYGIIQAGLYNQEFAVNTISSNHFQVYTNTTASSGYNSTNVSYTLGVPTVLILRRRGNEFRTYKDGVWIGTFSNAVNPTSSGSTYTIGGSYVGTMGSSATIHEVKQFSRALTDEEINIESKRLLGTINTSIHNDGTLYATEIEEGH